MSIAIFAFLSAWTWPSSNDSVNPIDTCWQVQPSSLSSGDMQNMCLSSGGGIYQPSAGGLSCVPEPYLQYITHIMSNNSCPWSVLYIDSMQQCPLGTTPSTHQPSAAVAFAQCIAIVNRTNSILLQKQKTDTERPVFGACEMEVVDPDVSWRGTHSRFIEQTLMFDQRLRNGASIWLSYNTLCSSKMTRTKILSSMMYAQILREAARHMSVALRNPPDYTNPFPQAVRISLPS